MNLLYIHQIEGTKWLKQDQRIKYDQSMELVVFQNILYVAFWYAIHVRFMVPINFQRSQSNCPFDQIKTDKLRNCLLSIEKLHLIENSQVLVSIKVLHETSRANGNEITGNAFMSKCN